MSNSSSTWLRLFSRIRCFLFFKTSSSSSAKTQSSDHYPFDKSSDIMKNNNNYDQKEKEEDSLIITLHRSVKNLHFGNSEEKESAAKEMKILARHNPKMRRSMVELGVIPPLVAMLGSEQVLSRRKLAVQVLLELANGIYTNKAQMVEAGILSKIPESVEELDLTTSNEFAELLLSISSLAHCQFPNLTASRTIPFLVSILKSNSIPIETKELCLAALYNLSTLLKNARDLITDGVANVLVQFSFVKETSEKALAILGNLVATVSGNKAMENNPTVPESFIEILTWEDQPKCQELAVYILMILAHQSPIHRLKMVKAGIVPVLLGVALLGSPLAQKRASKMLQWFKDERQVRMGPHSGPQMGGSCIAIGSPMNPREASEGKKMMRMLVKQSLCKNMETIVRRAGEAQVSSSYKTMNVYSSSKSFPY
ncbi:U-box domain-containing protein 7 [Impatiens glandulifera]|uniref:U-box domain-containing protein 7 n=1 Tax=Impatiens glandulifera TaxID=253017 RepID=UPI001FB085CD|nr:U-box domain-containing protein 7 [Impatiens glandulifera]